MSSTTTAETQPIHVDQSVYDDSDFDPSPSFATMMAEYNHVCTFSQSFDRALCSTCIDEEEKRWLRTTHSRWHGGAMCECELQERHIVYCCSVCDEIKREIEFVRSEIVRVGTKNIFTISQTFIVNPTFHQTIETHAFRCRMLTEVLLRQRIKMASHTKDQASSTEDLSTEDLSTEDLSTKDTTLPFIYEGVNLEDVTETILPEVGDTVLPNNYFYISEDDQKDTIPENEDEEDQDQDQDEDTEDPDFENEILKMLQSNSFGFGNSLFDSISRLSRDINLDSPLRTSPTLLDSYGWKSYATEPESQDSEPYDLTNDRPMTLDELDVSCGLHETTEL